MILLTILTLITIIAVITAVVFIGAVGGAIFVVLGDIVIFGLIIWLIIKLISWIRR